VTCSPATWSRKVPSCLLAMRPFHEQPDRFPLRGSTRSVLREHPTFGAKRDDIFPSFSSPGHPPESHLADGVGRSPTGHGGHRFGVPANPGATPWSYGCKPNGVAQTLAAHAPAKLGVVAIRACRPAPAQPQPVRNGTLDHLDPNSGLVLKRHLVGDVGLARRDGSRSSSRAGTARSPPHVLRACGNGQAAATWQIGDLADCARNTVVARPRSACPAFREARIVDIQSVTGSRAVIAASA